MPNQHDVSKKIVNYFCEELKAGKYHSSSQIPNDTQYIVRYAHPQICDSNWPKNENISLYLGKKEKGNGNSRRVAIPDVALINQKDKTVDILIEVESSKNFKGMQRSIGPISMADVYSPTYKYKFNSQARTSHRNFSIDLNDYSIKDLTLFILVLGEHREQFDEMRNRKIQISSQIGSSNEIRKITVYFESDDNSDQLFDKFKSKFVTIWPSNSRVTPEKVHNPPSKEKIIKNNNCIVPFSPS